MLRDNIVNDGKFAIATHKAEADCSTGMGVVIDVATKTFAVPSEETATDIYLIDKERIPTGINASKTDYSDYFEEFVTVEKDEFAKLVKYVRGESFLTDQIGSDVTADAVGKRVAVGTDGKWKVATVASAYEVAGIVSDNGHTLAKIQVKDTEAENA